MKYLIPLFLLTVPVLLQGQIRLRFSVRDGVTGLLASLVFLLPFALFLSHSGGSFTLLPPGAVFYQLLGVAFPEEVYFRGFLQEKTGNTFRGLFTVSVLFSLIHLPRFIFAGDATSLLTFFPSLVMGFLYRRTSNVLPSTLFHFLSNTVLLGFCDIL